MFYFVYKIVNKVNGKIYVGCHKTEDINDKYMGSGKYLKRAQEKYGIENFKREIIEVFNNSEDMFNMEAKLVNEEFVKSKDTYNLKEGGEGGWDYINSTNLNNNKKDMIEIGEKISKKLKTVHKENPELGKKHSLCMKKLHKEGKLKPFTGKEFLGCHHTKEAKKKIGSAASKRESGKGNSQYNTCWIFNEALKKNKKIKKEELYNWINEGWKKGRKKIYNKN